MKSSLLIVVLSFFKEEIKIAVNKIKYLYYFIKEFSILRFICYLINQSIIPSRNIVFRNYISKNSKKWKPRKVSVNNNSNKYILITNIVNHVGFTISEIIIGKNVMEMFNCHGVALLRKYDLKSKLIFESFGIKKFIFLDDSNFFMRTKYFLNAYHIVKSCKTMDDFIKFSLDEVNIGQVVYDHYLRFTGIGNINQFDHKMYLFLSQALSHHYQIKKYNEKFNFSACVQSERQFIPGGIIYQSSLINGTNVYSRSGPSNTFSVRKYSDKKEMWKTRERYSAELYDKISRNIKEQAIEIGGRNINKRFGGIPEYEVFHEYSEINNFAKEKKLNKNEKKNINKKELCLKLDWDENKPIVVVLATDLTDGVFDNTWSIFRDRLTWVRETFNQIKSITSVNWLIKPHPNDKKRKVVIDTISEYQKICSGHKHILPFPEEVSIVSIPKLVNAVVTLSGSASYEYPSFGIPVFQACESICSGRGFTIDPKSKEEYFDLLKKIAKINKLNKDQIDKAKIHAFIYSELTRIKVNLITPFRNEPVNNQSFWTKMINLIDSYNEEEDLLKKMMKIQEKNNDRHTINYDLLGK